MLNALIVVAKNPIGYSFVNFRDGLTVLTRGLPKMLRLVLQFGVEFGSSDGALFDVCCPRFVLQMEYIVSTKEKIGTAVEIGG